jgi:SAM-dependent methyltransferase
MMNKLDLCSGTAAPQRKREGYITIDARPFDGVDHVCNLGSTPLPFEDNTFWEIRAHDALEHIRDGFFELMDECWRVLRPNGIFDITVPRFPSPAAVMHPEHVQYFLGEQDALIFAKAFAPLVNREVERLFCIHSWAFFQVPADGIDPHGYLKGFWHLVDQVEVDSHLKVKLTPNKPGGRFPYKTVTRRV